MLFRFARNPINRRRIIALGVSLMLLGLAACCCTTDATNGHTTLVASGHPDWPPVMFAYEGKVDGVGPALAKKIFADLGIKAEFPAKGLWDEVQAKQRSGEVDMLVAAYKTAERQKYMVYSDAYIDDPLVLFVKKGREFAFAKNGDLVGKTGVGTTGDSYGEEFDGYIKANLKFVWAPTSKEALDLVENGKADYFIYSLYSGHEELKTEKRTTAFAILPHEVAKEPFYMTIGKNSPYVSRMPEINRLIQKYLADGTVAELTKQYKKQFLIDEIQ